MRKCFLISMSLICCLAFMGIKIRLDNIPRKKIPGSSLIYLPSGKYLKYFTFGYSNIAADFIYLWAIQYFSDQAIADRYKYLEHIFSIIAELDHRYLDPYELGAIIAIYEAHDLELALRILDKGLEKNPEQWIFPFQAGHYAQMFAKDYRLAQFYYQKTMEIKGAPPITKRLYANAAFKLMDYETAWQTWMEVYREADEDRIKKIASNHLYRVKAALDIEAIKEAIMRFKETHGRNPSTLSQLVRLGFLESLPKDFDGNDYLYDPKTGEVSPPIIPWKR